MSGVVGGIAAGAILLILRTAARNARPSTGLVSGTRVVRYPTVARSLTWFLALIPFGLWAALLQAPPDQTRIGIIVCASLTVGAFVLFLEFTYARASWTDAGLVSRSPWRGTRTIEWNDVVEVRFSRAASGIVIRGGSGGVIRISTLFGGLEELLGILSTRVAPVLQPSIDEVISHIGNQSPRISCGTPDVIERMTKLEHIEARLLALLLAFDCPIPEHQLKDMKELCIAGEPGIALENFATQLDEYDVKVDAKMIDEMESLGNEMGLDPRYWEWLRSRL